MSKLSTGPVPLATSSRGAKTRERIFSAAMQILSGGQSQGINIEQLAAAAGVSKGTVYYTFGSRAQLSQGLLDYGTDRLRAALLGATETVKDPRQGLQQGIYASFEFLYEHPGFAHMWLQEGARQVGFNQELLGLRQDVLGDLHRLVSRLALNYHPDNAQDVSAISVALVGAMFMLSLDRTVHGTQRSAEDATRTVMLIVDGYIHL